MNRFLALVLVAVVALVAASPAMANGCGAQAQVFAAPVYQQQVFAQPVYAVPQFQAQVYAAPVPVFAQQYAAPVFQQRQVIVQRQAAVAYAAPVAAVAAPSRQVIRQRTVIGGGLRRPIVGRRGRNAVAVQANVVAY